VKKETPQIAQSDYMRIPEASRYLKLSPDKIRQLIKDKAFPSYKPLPRIIFLKKTDLNSWIERNQQ